MVNRNTVNDEEIKTWYVTGSEPSPTWVEQLVVAAYQSEFANGLSNIHVKVELRYIVQFKDLQQKARYPVSNTSTAEAISLLVGVDTEQRPAPRYTPV